MVLFPGGRELFYPGGFRYPSCAWSIRAQMNETFHKQYLKKALPSLNFSLIIRHNARLEQVQASVQAAVSVAPFAWQMDGARYPVNDLVVD